jgi:hypothetical protein
MFILLINYVISESQRKGTAVLRDREIFAGLSTEVVATGAGICDKALKRRQDLSQSSLKTWVDSTD